MALDTGFCLPMRALLITRAPKKTTRVSKTIPQYPAESLPPADIFVP